MAAINVTDELAGGAAAPVVVAVIPAYNEERFIASVILTALQYADRVIVVDDGSTDRTARVAGLAGAEIVVMAENGGKGRALNAGLNRACERGADVVVTLDGDAQHDPADIPQLCRPILAGDADVVIGSRFLDVRSKIPIWRQFGQHALTFVTNRASGIDTTDSQSGFRALTACAARALHFHTGGLAVESEMQFQLRHAALRVVEVPVHVQYRDGNKRNPIRHGLQVLDAVLSLVARRRPLLFLGVPGVALTALGALVGALVVARVDEHHAVPLGTTMLVALLVMVGLVLCVTAVILNTLEHYTYRIGEEVRREIRQSWR